MNTPPISTHVTPPWLEDETEHDIHVEFYFIGLGEEEWQEDYFTVCAYDYENDIREAVKEKIYNDFGNRQYEIEITQLDID